MALNRILRRKKIEVFKIPSHQRLIQIKPTLRLNLSPTKVTINRKEKEIIQNADEEVEKNKLLLTLHENLNFC